MERDEKKALIAAGVNITDRVFPAEEVRLLGDHLTCVVTLCPAAGRLVPAPPLACGVAFDLALACGVAVDLALACGVDRVCALD